MFETMATGTVRLRLSNILKERNIRQVELAKMTGLSENAISDLTGNGVRQVRLDTLAKICDSLGLNPSDLFEYIPGSEEEEIQ